MFIKETQPETIEEKPKPKNKQGKPKRQLTEKQLEGLRKGREKMAEKRRIKKAMEEKKKALQKKDVEATNENTKTEKKERQAKKKAVEESVKQELSYKEKKAKAEKSQKKFNKLKVEALEKIKSSKEMEEFEKIMNGVSNDMAKNPEMLYRYLREHADRLAPEKQRKAFMESKIKTSKGRKSPKRKPNRIQNGDIPKNTETTEEKKPNLKLNIEDVK